MGPDFLLARAVMKRKHVLTPWAAARGGFSGQDWGASFFKCLKLLDSPGPDFLLFEPISPHGVKRVPASYSKVQNYMRIVLCHKLVGLSVGEALEYTLHSWRHVYPTLGTQLGLEDPQLTALGHWNRGSCMPQHYDALTNSTEIRGKQRVLLAVLTGYKMAAQGAFLQNEDGTTPDAAPQNAQQEIKCTEFAHFDHVPHVDPCEDENLPVEKGDLAAKETTDDCPVDIETQASPTQEDKPRAPLVSGSEKIAVPVQVLDTLKGKVHLYTAGCRSMCNTWDSGSMEFPMVDKKGKPRAKFMESWDSINVAEDIMSMCKTCYSAANAQRLKGIAPIPVFKDLERQAFEDIKVSSCDESLIDEWSDDISGSDYDG